MNWNSPTVAKIRSTKVRSVVKPPLFGLTETDKARVIKDFIDIMRRSPTQEEVLELYSEEAKIKQGSNQR